MTKGIKNAKKVDLRIDKGQVAPIEIYNHYALAILLDILKEKDMFDNKDMNKLIRRLNVKLRKLGYA